MSKNIWDVSQLVPAPDRRQETTFIGKITYAEERVNKWGKPEVYLEIQPEGKQYIRKQWFVISKIENSGWGKFLLALNELGCIPQSGDIKELIGLTFVWKSVMIPYTNRDGIRKETERIIPVEIVSGKVRKIVKKEEEEEEETPAPKEKSTKEKTKSEEKSKSEETSKTEPKLESKPATKPEKEEDRTEEIKEKLLEFIGDEPLTMQEIFGEMLKSSYKKRETILALGQLEKEGKIRKNDDGTIVAVCEDAEDNSEPDISE